MKKISLCLAILCVITLSLAAQNLKEARTYEEVTPAGVETFHEYGPFTVDSCGKVTTNRGSAAGLLWSYPDNGLAWIPRNVSIGDRGTQVCAALELNNEAAELFSVFDSNPPVPIWQDTSLYGADMGFMCSSSSKGDYHVVMYQVNNPDIMNRNPVVNCYDSQSNTPLWTWTYPNTINHGSRVAIDRKGTVVAVVVYNNNTGMIELFFFDPATGTQTSSYSQSSAGLRGFDLSADGSTLYFHDGAYGVNIFDIAANGVIFTTSTGGSFDGHCISGDGTKFAFGGFGDVKMWEFDGTNWTDFVFSTGSGNYADEMDFSDDGSTLGFGVSQYNPSYTQCEAYIMDVATKAIVSHAVFPSSGSYQDVCSGASISRDGSHFVSSRWGDQFNTNAEVQILEKGNNTPVGSIDTQGSAFAVDMSADGQVTVSGCKAVHANVSGNGGAVDCYDLGDEDVVAHGKPHVGSSFQLDIYGVPNWYYIPYRCSADIPMGTTIPAANGTLYLNITAPFAQMYMAQMPSSGNTTDTINIPGSPGLAGVTQYIQVVHTTAGAPLYLSKDYVTITILP